MMNGSGHVVVMQLYLETHVKGYECKNQISESLKQNSTIIRS